MVIVGGGKGEVWGGIGGNNKVSEIRLYKYSTRVCENCWRLYRIGTVGGDGELRHYALGCPCARYEQWGIFCDHIHELSWGKRWVALVQENMTEFSI